MQAELSEYDRLAPKSCEFERTTVGWRRAKVMAIMLIELWERLRGYDKWVETEARIVSYETLRRRLPAPQPKPISGRVSGDLITWKDGHGARHYGTFINLDTSPLYQLLEGEKTRIRYNPANPDRYYHRQYFLHWVALIEKGIAILVVCGGFIGWQVWTIIAHHGR